MIPLAVEAALLALSGFGTGLVIGYIVELRHRANRWKKGI